MTQLDPKRTALVLIDLQNGIVGLELAPYSGAEVVETGKQLAERFRAAGAPVVLVRVAWAADFADALKQAVDQPPPRPAGGLPENWSTLVDGLEKIGDIVMTKRHWGAFHMTELDLQLRRRGIDTIVLGGIATNFGVESTARQAWELGYSILLAQDACSAPAADMHEFSITRILPRISRLTRSQAITFEEPM